MDDAAVDALGAELGLGPSARVSHEGVSWYRAASSEDDAAITVVGPHRTEDPSGEGESAFSTSRIANRGGSTAHHP